MGSPEGVCVQLSTDRSHLVRVGVPPMTETVELGLIAGTLMSLVTLEPSLSVVVYVPLAEARATNWAALL